MVILITAALLLAGGGVMHAYAKNCQVQVAREIDASQSRAEEYLENVKMLQVKIERKQNRHTIRDELARRDSHLCAISSQDIEVVEPIGSASEPVASSTP